MESGAHIDFRIKLCTTLVKKNSQILNLFYAPGTLIVTMIVLLKLNPRSWDNSNSHSASTTDNMMRIFPVATNFNSAGFFFHRHRRKSDRKWWMASFVSGERKKQDGGRTNERRQPVNDEETTDESALSLLVKWNVVECYLVCALVILSFFHRSSM